jgi:hypothetical protein
VDQPVTSSWFVEETYVDTSTNGNGNGNGGGNGGGNGDGTSSWLTPAATAPVPQQQAPVAPVAPVPAPRPVATTSAGLPVRTPGARAVPAERQQAAPQTGFRDPESIRNNLSRHYDGVLAARRAREEEDPGAGGIS